MRLPGHEEPRPPIDAATSTGGRSGGALNDDSPTAPLFAAVTSLLVRHGRFTGVRS